MTAKKRGKTRKQVLIAIVLLVIFGVIIALGIYQNPWQVKNYTAAEYFDISVGIEPWADDKVLNNGTTMIIHAIVVTVTATEGDAHSVVVQSWAGSDLVDLGDIPKGESRRDYMVSSDGARITRGEDGLFSVTLSIASLEASGRMTVRFQ